MNDVLSIHDIIRKLGKRFGVLAESDTTRLKVIASNEDVAIGDLFLLPSQRGSERIYVFRTTHYANTIDKAWDAPEIARTKLTRPNSYLSEKLSQEFLLELTGIVLGYAERSSDKWTFHKPRRLPDHFTEVYRVDFSNPHIGEVMQTLMHHQLGTEGLYLGDLMAGEQALPVPVHLPIHALSHHLGIYGRTGTGKSNLMMVLLQSIFQHNRTTAGRKGSILAIDPHDEFRGWHSHAGGRDGVRGLVLSCSPAEQQKLVAPHYYLTAKQTSRPFETTLKFSLGDITPEDLISIMDFTEQQVAYSTQQFSTHGEHWITQTLLANPENDPSNFMPGTISAVQRRLGFLRTNQTRIFTPYNPTYGRKYDSLLPEILCSLEQGRVLIIDTTLLSELEQFLVTTVIARALFALRKALKSVEDPEQLEGAIRQGLSNDDPNGQIGQRTLADQLIQRLQSGQLPYLRPDGALKGLEDLPHVNIVIEEAPSILNPTRLRFGSVFRDISRQGRKFGLGLTVVSQQVTQIDSGILSQINTEITLALGNEQERKEAVKNASNDLAGFEKELQVMGKGQAIVTASYKDIPLPVQISDFDVL